MFNGERLKTARMKKGVKQRELAEQLGVKTSLISKYETGKIRNPKQQTIENIADILGVTIQYLVDSSDFMETPDLYDKDDLVKVPVYGSVIAGKPIEALEVDYGYVGLEPDRFKGEKQFIGLKVKGDSMYPFYLEDDVIIVEITTEFNSGDDVVVFIGRDYEATLKRIHKKEDHIELEPLNKMYPVRKFGKDDAPIRVFGVVREVRRKM